MSQSTVRTVTDDGTHSNRGHRLSSTFILAQLRRAPNPYTRTRTTRLHLRDVLLAEAELLVDAKHVLADGEGRHAVHVVRDTAEQLGALSRRE